MAPQFVVTPWRDANELLTVRNNLFAVDSEAQENAVNKVRLRCPCINRNFALRRYLQVLAWRARKLELPLLLESTADIVEAKLHDEAQDLPTHALRLVYATAISRFVTGLLDTQTDFTRLSLPSQTAPLVPVSLRETRHRIVHRHLPSLAELKRAASESLDWLWEHYWSHLDALLSSNIGAHQLSEREVKERLQGVLKSYVKERKAEIKSRSKDGRAADSAVGSYLSLEAAKSEKTRALVDLLVLEKNILPVGKKLGSSMEGAYLIWTPFVTALGMVDNSFLEVLTERMVDMLSAPPRAMSNVEDDPAREGICGWMVHILEAKDQSQRRLLDRVLGLCLTTPTFWTLRLVEELLKDDEVPGRQSWLAILEAAKLGAEDEAQSPPVDDMEVDTITAEPLVSESKHEAKQIRGPQKYPGLWRPLPIGWIPPGWSEEG